ncbi:MAG: DUF434 domain-containing protein [Bacteroidetes bacterium]|nr:MAG: DUF434 domain-containing protein [Bacteroidota bacterium]
MPHTQRHRGQHSLDPRLFHPQQLPVLNQAVKDMSYLLTRGYGENGALKLVGDRYRLTQRQRKAVLRASCSDQALAYRLANMLEPADIQNQAVVVDGYNLLITVESALGGGIVLACRDSCYRDIASVHSTYRKVAETLPALTLIGTHLRSLGCSHITWYLDAPISNSGRLRHNMLALSEEKHFGWEVLLANNPDKKIAASEESIAISSDSWVIDHSRRWFNLHRFIVDQIPGAHLIALRGS